MPYIFSKCHTLRAVSPTPQVPPIPGHRGRTLAADVNPGSHAGSTGAWDEMQWKRYQYSWHCDRPCVAMDLIGARITPPHDSARPGKAGSDQGGATEGHRRGSRRSRRHRRSCEVATVQPMAPQARRADGINEGLAVQSSGSG